jgi:hypothetical protein
MVFAFVTTYFARNSQGAFTIEETIGLMVNSVLYLFSAFYQNAKIFAI